jgi:hypothetical protein
LLVGFIGAVCGVEGARPRAVDPDVGERRDGNRSGGWTTDAPALLGDAPEGPVIAAAGRSSTETAVRVVGVAGADEGPAGTGRRAVARTAPKSVEGAGSAAT